MKAIAGMHGMSQPTLSRRKKMLVEEGYCVADGRNVEYTDEGKDWLE